MEAFMNITIPEQAAPLLHTNLATGRFLRGISRFPTTITSGCGQSFILSGFSKIDGGKCKI